MARSTAVERADARNIRIPIAAAAVTAAGLLLTQCHEGLLPE
jgi:hypothetical protein